MNILAFYVYMQLKEKVVGKLDNFCGIVVALGDNFLWVGLMGEGRRRR
jgi:hypothetical protein